MSDVTASIVEWIQTTCTRDRPHLKIEASTPLLDLDLLDSLDFLGLVSFIEERYNVRMDADAMVPENFETPQVITNVVNQLRERRV